MKQDYLVITGANGQMGAFLAKWPGLKCYPKLLLFHQRQERLDEIENDANNLKLACDLMDATALQAAFWEATNHFGGSATRLIHTAALRSSDAKSLVECDDDFYFRILNHNVMGCMNVLKAVLPLMIEAAFGRIVLFGSVVTQTGLANGAAYAAAKAAIVNIAKSIALENAKDGILINCLSPGPIETALDEDYQGEYLKFRQEYFEAYKQKTPTKKLVSKAELALLCESLVSDKLQNLTGQEIIINGGYL